jgi:hypothetical protein
MLVALTANLFNLLDRAPGRACKFGLLVAAPIALGAPSWAAASSGLLGALVAVLPADLAERLMLGDNGANPLGAVLGLGLAMALPEPWRALAVVAVLALNLTSERISFSQVIERTPGLRAFDGIGRK